MVKKEKTDISGEKTGYFADYLDRRFWLWPALLLIGLYRLIVSPVLYAIGVRCRHKPSCSVYAAEALTRHGLWRGGWLSFSRLMRCHPWGSHGFDEVPQEAADVGWQFWRLGDWAWTARGAMPQEEKDPASSLDP